MTARNFLLPAGLDGGPGGLSKEIMPDTTPPSPKGHEIWAKAMEPELISATDSSVTVKLDLNQRQVQFPITLLAVEGRGLIAPVAADFIRQADMQGPEVYLPDIKSLLFLLSMSDSLDFLISSVVSPGKPDLPDIHEHDKHPIHAIEPESLLQTRPPILSCSHSAPSGFLQQPGGCRCDLIEGLWRSHGDPAGTADSLVWKSRRR